MVSVKKKLAVYFFSFAVAMFSLSATTSYAGGVDERPDAGHMIGDTLTRPFLLVATVAGTVLYIGTLPFSLLGGNAGEAGQKLVVEPFKMTFFRCLGCTTRNMGK
jgi:hypothetical protein